MPRETRQRDDASPAPAGEAFGRKPPQNIEAERAVLGAMLINPDAVGTAIEVLREDPTDLFYLEAHRLIYQAMLTLFQAHKEVDEVTVVGALTQANALEQAGGFSYVAELTSAVPTSANVEYYSEIVRDAALLRKLISTCTDLAGDAYRAKEGVSELLNRAEAAIFKIAERRQIRDIVQVGSLLEGAVHQLEELIKSHTGITGLATGFHELDEKLAGLQKSDMVILAARPSVGKTAFALNIASHAAIQLDKSVLVFSLEMAKEQLMQRLLCMEGGIDSMRLRTGFLAKDEFRKVTPAADKLMRAKIFIDDSTDATVLDIRSKARRHAAQHDLDLVIIDYLQLMHGPKSKTNNRQEEVSAISRGIKGIARELRVPVLALSQLNREPAKDDEGRPRLSQLRESGAIEQDADVVLMLWRPKKKDEEEEQLSRDEQLVKMDVAKQRNGPTGDFDLLFNARMQRFKNTVRKRDMQHVPKPPPETAPAPSPIQEPPAELAQAVDAVEFEEPEDDGDGYMLDGDVL